MSANKYFSTNESNDFVVILSGRIIYVILTVLSIKIMSTTLSEIEIGNYYLIIAYIFFFTSGLISPFGSYISRNINIWKSSNNVINALVVYFFYSLVISIFSVVVAFLLLEILGYPVQLDLTKLYFYIFLSILIGNTHNGILGLANIIGFRSFYIRFLILTIVMGLGFAISINQTFGASALNWLFGFLLSEILLIAIVFYRLSIKLDSYIDLETIRKHITKERALRIFIYSTPLFIVMLLSWAQNYSYRFLIDYKYGLETLALIGLGFSIASSIMSTLESIISQYLNPIFYQKISSVEKEERIIAFKKNINTALPIYFLTAFFIIGLAPFLVKVLVDQKFYYAYIYLSVGAVIELFKVSINHGKLIFYSEYKNNLIVIPILTSAIFSLVLLYYADLNNRYILIGLILLASFFIYAVMIYANIKKIIGEKILNKKLLILSVCLGSLFLSALYFNDSSDFSILNNMAIIFAYGIVFVIMLALLQKKLNKN